MALRPYSITTLATFKPPMTKVEACAGNNKERGHSRSDDKATVSRSAHISFVIAVHLSGSLGANCDAAMPGALPDQAAACGAISACLAVAGGLISVLEIVAPFWQTTLRRSVVDSQEMAGAAIVQLARSPASWGMVGLARCTTGRTGACRSSEHPVGVFAENAPWRDSLTCEGEKENAHRAGEDCSSGQQHDCYPTGFLVLREGGSLGWHRDGKGEGLEVSLV